jgi:hypothetical protein
VNPCLIRLWRSFDLEEVREHLMVVGDTVGDCSHCRALGIDPWNAKKCQECGAEFRYISSRRLSAHPSERFRWIRRVQQARPDLSVIDYEDFQKAAAEQKAKDFFST